MKTLLIVVVATVLFSSGSLGQISQASIITPGKVNLGKTTQNQSKVFQNMIGSWEIVGEQEAGGGLEIIDSTTILIRFMGEEKRLIEYKIDFSKSPYWFDFSAKDTDAVINFKSIIEFVNDDMLKWQVFVDEERTNHFTSTRGELFYLRRARAKSNNISYSDTR